MKTRKKAQPRLLIKKNSVHNKILSFSMDTVGIITTYIPGSQSLYLYISPGLPGS
jgi:hypothetical protein